jgi:hypothetical protein
VFLLFKLFFLKEKFGEKVWKKSLVTNGQPLHQIGALAPDFTCFHQNFFLI